MIAKVPCILLLVLLSYTSSWAQGLKLTDFSVLKIHSRNSTSQSMARCKVVIRNEAQESTTDLILKVAVRDNQGQELEHWDENLPSILAGKDFEYSSPLYRAKGLKNLQFKASIVDKSGKILVEQTWTTPDSTDPKPVGD